jgi:hypothetical protein
MIIPKCRSSFNHNSFYFKNYCIRSIKSPYSIEEEVTSPPAKKSGPYVSQSQGASLKQKRGERGCNKMPSGAVYVTTLDLNELPTEPTETRKAFKRAYGF